MSTAGLVGVSTRLLGDKAASLKNKRDEIIAALGLLFTGYDAALHRRGCTISVESTVESQFVYCRLELRAKKNVEKR